MHDDNNDGNLKAVEEEQRIIFKTIDFLDESK
jgi:hypothetical protein